MQKKSEIWKRIFSLAKTESKSLTWGLIFLAVSSGSNLVYPQVIRKIVDGALSTHNLERINQMAFFMLVVFTFQGIASSARYFLFTNAGERIVMRLRQNLYAHILEQDIAFFDFNKTGELMSRISSDSTVLQNTVSVNISMALRNLAGALGGLALMIYTSAQLALSMLVVIPPVILSALIFGKRIRAFSKNSQDSLAQASVVAEETISGIRTVRAFAQENFEKNRYTDALKFSYQAARNRIAQIAWFIGLASVIGYGAVSGVVWYGGRQVVMAQMSIGDLTQFLIYLMITAFSLGSLGGLWGDFMAALGAAKRVFEILDREPEVNNSRGTALSKLSGKVEFKKVSFHYPTRRDLDVLHDMSFVLAPGKSVALVGPSGSGKTTVASLLIRLYEATKGAISIDGIGINELQPDWLRRQIGIVSQEPILISATIEENIRYGNPLATKEDVISASKAANSHNFIQTFPNGYQTLVGERGIQLSGGQKQRVAIARAILKDPKILILDEATSALDAESEHLVQEALQRLMQGRTTLVIAHRLATIKNCDLILVMEQGHVLEAGAHEHLIALNGAYKKLIERQFFKDVVAEKMNL